MPSEHQTVWTLIRPKVSSGLIPTICQGYQQTTMVDKELIEQTGPLPTIFST